MHLRDRFFLGIATMILTALTLGTASAQIPVQIINNCPDPSVASIDVYVDDAKVAEDLTFKTATPFVDGLGQPVILVGPTSKVDVVDGADADNSNPLHSETLLLTQAQPTLIEVIGVVDPGQFDPNPDGRDISLDLLIFEGYKAAAANPLTTELMAVHAAPNVGAIDLVVRAQHDVPGVGLILFSALAYGETRDYIVLQPVVATLDIVESGTSNVIESYSATLGLIVGAAAVGNAGGIYTPIPKSAGDTVAQPATHEGLSLFGVVASGFVFELNHASRTNVDSPRSSAVVLGQPYPNPFNPTTTIPLLLDRSDRISLKVFDLQGRLVRTLLDGPLAEGRHDVPFFGADLSSGTYLLQLRSTQGATSRTMTLLK
jgi:hypothetical protein